MDDDDLYDLPLERRSTDRRRDEVVVPNDRRQTDRRANRIAPAADFAGVAVVLDSWPLMRAGITQLLQSQGYRVAGEGSSAAEVVTSVGDRLDLAVIGATHELAAEAVERVRRIAAPPDGTHARVLLLMERVDAEELRHLLAIGVEGVVQRSIGMADLGAACERLRAGHRVLSGGPLSVLASAGLRIAEPEAPTRADGGGLTRKELEVLSHLGQHRSNREIADQMHLSEATVKSHLSKIYAKLGVAGRREAIVSSVQRGLLT